MSVRRRVLDYRIDPFDLQLFVAVLREGSITAGARAASLSLPAASARLKALEHRVGVPLLERSKAGAAPTDAGRALVRQAHRVLADLDALHLEMAAHAHGLRGTLRLAGNTAAAERLPALLGRFLVARPDVDVELLELPSDAALLALRAGEVDLAIVADHAEPAGLAVEPWVEDELVALLPDRRAAAAADDASPCRYARLLDRPFVGLGAGRGLSRFLAAQAARSGRVPHHRVRAGGFDAVAALVAAGVGVAVVPRSAAERWRSAGLRIAPLADGWARRRLLICRRADAAPVAALAALVEMLKAPGSQKEERRR